MDKREEDSLDNRALVLVANNIPESLSREEIIRYFMSYGIRVDCQILQLYSRDHYSGPIRQLKLYCPSRYTKENLQDSAHLIFGNYLELQDPFNNLCHMNKKVVLEPTFSTDLHAFNSRDLKVYFTQLAMEHGLALKVDLVQGQKASRSRPIFRVLTSSIEEAKKLARTAHQVGSLSFRLVISSQRDETENINQLNPFQSYQGGEPFIQPEADSSSISYSTHKNNQRQNVYPGQEYRENEIDCQDNFSDFRIARIPQKKLKNTKLSESSSELPSKLNQFNTFINRDRFSDVSNDYSQSAREHGFYRVQDQSQCNPNEHWEEEFTQQACGDHLPQNHLQTGQLNQAIQHQGNQERPFVQKSNRNYHQNAEINPAFNNEQRWDTQVRNRNVYHQMQNSSSDIQEFQKFPMDGVNSSVNPGSERNNQAFGRNQHKINDQNMNHFSQKNGRSNMYHGQQSFANSELDEGYYSQRFVAGDQNCMDYLSSGPSLQEESYVLTRGASLNQSQYDTPSQRNISQYSQHVNQYGENINTQLIHTASMPVAQGERDSNRIHCPYETQVNIRNVSDASAQFKSRNRPFAITGETPSLLSSDHTQAYTPSEIKTVNTERKDKGESKNKSRSGSPPSKYDTLLITCYGKPEELSALWLRRIQKMAQNLKEMPHNMFGQMRSDKKEKEELKKFSDISELHPIGKFIHKKSQQLKSAEDDSELEEEQGHDKYDHTSLVNLEFGHVNFGGNHFVHEYVPWRGVSQNSEQILIGSVSKGRLAKLPADADFEIRALIIEQAHQDVVQWRTMFRSALMKQRIKDEIKIQEKEKAMLGLLSRTCSTEFDGKPDDLVCGGDNATKSSSSNRSCANNTVMSSILTAGAIRSKEVQSIKE